MRTPLFCRDQDQKLDDVDYDLLRILKQIDGNWEWHPATFPVHEFRSTQDLSDRWGGGLYELIACRDDETQTQLQRRKYRIPGRAKRFLPDDSSRDDDKPTAANVPAAPSIDPMLAMMMQMFQGQQAEARAERQAAERRFEAQREETRNAMMMMFQQQQAQSAAMLDLFKGLATGNGANAATSYETAMNTLTEAVTLGMTLAKENIPPQATLNGADPMTALAVTAQQFTEGMKVLKDIKQGPNGNGANGGATS